MPDITGQKLPAKATGGRRPKANKFQLNPKPCAVNQLGDHIWSPVEDDHVKLCILCYEPKIVTK